jgi:hypothetical protein
VTHSTRRALYRTDAFDHRRDTGASPWLSASVAAGDRFGSGDGLRARWDRWSLCSLKGWRRCRQRLDPTRGEPALSHQSSGKARGCTRTSSPTFTTSLRIRDSQNMKPLDGCAPCSIWERDSRGGCSARGSSSGPRRTSWTQVQFGVVFRKPADRASQTVQTAIQRCVSRSAEGHRPSAGMSRRSVILSRQFGVSNGLPQ